MYTTKDFRKNLKIEIDGEPYIIVEAQHVKPGKGVAFVKTKYKSLITGRVHSKTFRSGEKVDKPALEERGMQYLYQDGDAFVFMDTANYEQLNIQREALEETLPFLKDNLEVSVLFHNERPINIELPTFVEVTITYTEPGFKGDTATGVTKPATIETGHEIQVPLYIGEGERVKVDTRDGKFVERVKT